MKKLISIIFCMLLITTTISVIGIEVVKNDEKLDGSLLKGDPGWIMQVENTTAESGTTGHVIQINGTWAEELDSFSMKLEYDNEMIEIDEINADGCVAEVYQTYVYIFDNIFTYSAVIDPPIPAGEGKLGNIVVNVTGDFGVTELNFVEGGSTYYNYYGGVHHPIIINGTLTIVGDDTTPPETTIELDGDMQGADYISDVTVTLSATDDLSGVAATYIKVDDGVYEEYTDPVVVSGLGSHTVYYYSEDNAGNEEDEKSETFDIVEEILEPDISIKSIDGGTGITAVIENTGEGDATDVEWTITIEGGFFILTKEATDVIESIEAGDEAEITMSVFGIGLGILTDMPVITVEAECAEGSSDDDSVEAQIILSKVTIQE